MTSQPAQRLTHSLTGEAAAQRKQVGDALVHAAAEVVQVEPVPETAHEITSGTRL